MINVSANSVRSFLIELYSDNISATGIDPKEVSDDFDLFLEGVIDSVGIMEMISAVEGKFGIEMDLEELDAEELTIIGPFSRFVEEFLLRGEHERPIQNK